VKSFVHFVDERVQPEILLEDELFDPDFISPSSLSNFNPDIKTMEKTMSKNFSKLTIEKKQTSPQVVKKISKKERKIENISEYSLNYESLYSFDDLNLAFKKHLESEYNLGNFVN
jgi:hypothetical protein